MKFLRQLCSLLLLVGMAQFAFAQNVTITAPASVAGDYPTQTAAFGNYPLGESASIVLIDDGTGVSNGCAAASNAADLLGNIAMIDRGACGFSTKVANAEAAGAIAVIVCNNNDAEPDAIITMASGGNCAVSLPSVMMSYGNCETIKVELANGLAGTMPVTDPVPALGESVSNPIALTGPGTYTATELTGQWGELDADGPKAQVYSITAPADNVMNVNSCLGGIDTRLAIVQGCRGGLSLVGLNDDFCEMTAGSEEYASSLDVLVNAGEEYLIHWDNRWDSTGFDFTVSFAELAEVAVTFTVDMSAEMVDPANPPMIAGSFNSFTQEPMTDNGDGTWSATYMIEQGEDIQYKFLNGMDEFEPSAALESCGVDDGFGGFNRVYSVGLDAEQNLPTVCFSSCDPCPQVGCFEAMIDDNLDSYTVGAINAQGPHWTTWGGTPGGADDGEISTGQALSGANSVYIDGGQAADVLLLLGDQSSGKWMLKWDIFVDEGQTGYYNIQDEETPGVTWNIDVFFNADGTGSVDQTGTTFNYAQGEWVSVVHYIDLDNDLLRLTIGGAVVEEAFAYTGNIGSVDFYSNGATNSYYVDNVLFKQASADSAPLDCLAGSIICDNLEAYSVGDASAQSPYLTPWTGSTSALISTDFSTGTDCQSLKVDGNVAGLDQLLLLGDRTSGSYVLSWKQYVPAGNAAYHNIQKIEGTPGGEFGNQVFFLADGTGTVDSEGTGTFTFTYAQDEWVDVSYFVDVDQDNVVLTVGGEVAYSNPLSSTTAAAGGMNQLGAINLFPIDETYVYYVDDISFRALPDCADDAIFCDYFEGYQAGTSIIGAAPWWTGWSATTPGTAEDAFVTTDQASSPVNSLNIGDNGSSDIVLLLDDQETGVYDLTWDMYVPAGATGYFNLQGAPAIGTVFVFEAVMNGDGTTPGEGIINGTAFTMTYPEDAWFPVHLVVDTDNDVYSMFVNDIAVFEDEPFTAILSAVDFFSINANNNYYIDNVIYRDITPVTPDPVDVTFTVNMEQTTVSAEGVFLTGTFNGWPNPGDAMTDNGDGTWSITVPLTPGATEEFKYQNGIGIDGWENDFPDSGCGMNSNRFLVVGDSDSALDVVCFNQCVDCIISVEETAFASALNLFPNPTSNATSVTYNFSETVDLDITVSNTMGQQLYTASLGAVQNGVHNIDLTKFAAGIYFVQMTDGTNNLTKRLIVE